MQVRAISTNNNSSVKSFGNSPIEQFASLSDKQLKMISAEKTYNKKALKKRNFITNTLIALVPVGSFTAALLATKGKNASRIAKIDFAALQGLKSAAAIGTGLGTFALIHKAEKSNDNINNFTSNHPILSFLASIATACGVYALAIKGTSSLYKSLAPIIKSHMPEKFTKFINNTITRINNSKKITNIIEKIKSLPNPIKSAIEFVGRHAEGFAITSVIAYPFINNASLDKKYVQTYNDIKAKQNIIKTAIDIKKNDKAESV